MLPSAKLSRDLFQNSVQIMFLRMKMSQTTCKTLTLTLSKRALNPQHRGTSAKEKKTVTLFIVIGVSVLAMIPVTLYKFLPINIQTKLASDRYKHVGYAIDVIYFTSSIVNPIVYAIRLREFRNTIRKILGKQGEAGVDFTSRSAQ